MSLATIIQVGLGLMLAWLVLSMVVMYVQEWIVSRLGLRSKMLETTLYNMLTDPAIADQFYDHPLIQGLFSGENGEQKPSYIPSQQFVITLFDIVMNAGKESSLLQQEIYKMRSEIGWLKKDEKARAEAQYQFALLAARKALATNLGGDALNQAVENVKTEISRLAEISPDLQPAVEKALENVTVNKAQVDALLAQFQAQNSGLTENPTLDQVRVGVAALAVTQPQLKQALETLLQGAEEYAIKGESALTTARVSVESWFDDSMDRLSGWYKRRAQKMAFVIGIVVAIVANGDTVLLAQQLWRDPGLRLSLVAQAQEIVDKQTNVSQPTLEQLTQLQAQFNGLNIPFGWVGTPIGLDTTGRVPGMEPGVTHTCTLFPTTADDVYGFAVAGQCYPISNAPHLNDLTGWILKLSGLVVSGLAAAQGAPFWFDLLKRFVNIRSTGTNPVESKAGG
jgi:hypothetical protein